MLERKALQTVREYRQIPGESALPKVLVKTRFGDSILVQQAHKKNYSVLKG